MPGTSEAVPPLVARECCAAEGRLFTFVDLAADPHAPPSASALVVPGQDGSAELRRLTTASSTPPGVVPRLLAILADLLRASGCRALLVTVPEVDGERCGRTRRAGLFRFRAAAGDVRLRLAL